MFGSTVVNGSTDNVLGGLDLGMLSPEDQAIMNLVKDFRAQALETYRQPFIMVLMVVYGFVFLLSLAGNGLVLFVVLGNRSMRTTTNYFLLNMSVADLLGKLISLNSHEADKNDCHVTRKCVLINPVSLFPISHGVNVFK